MFCLATSLGELLSIYPTSLGQAYFIVRMGAGRPYTRTLSYVTGWINMAGWWTLIASFSLFCATFYISVIQLFIEGWQIKPYQNFLIFEATIWSSAFANIVMTRIDRVLPLFNTIMMISNLLIFSGSLITMLTCTGIKHQFQSGRFIFATWINASGWPDGFAFLQGLLTATYGFTAFDSVVSRLYSASRPVY